MLSSFVKKIIGSKNDRQLRRMDKKVKQIGALEEELLKLSDEELKARSLKLKERAHAGESLDDLLVEAFAVCRETDNFLDER